MLSHLPREIFERLNTRLHNTVKQFDHVNGVFILSTKPGEPAVYSRSIKDFSHVTQIAELCNSLNVSMLIKRLEAKGYHGIDIINFPDFAVGLLKLTDTEILAVLISNHDDITHDISLETILKELRASLFDTSIDRQLRSMPNPKDTAKSKLGGPPKPGS